MKILKFGGSSLASAERVKNVVNIIVQANREEEKVAIVVSAFGGVTDELLQMGADAEVGNKDYIDILEGMKAEHFKIAEELFSDDALDRVNDYMSDLFHQLQEVLHGIYLVKELTLKTQDFLASFGERLSAYCVAESLSNHGVSAEMLDARKVIKTDDQFGAALVNFDLTFEKIRAHFANQDRVQVVTGFIASTENDETTTLGRDGSDYTSSMLASALEAKEVEIWTDVDGVMTCDPRKVSTAFPIAMMTYEEAMEMSHFGAKVLHPPTIQPVMKNKIPIRIKNSMNPSFPGTVINCESAVSQFVVKGITSIDEISLLSLKGTRLIDNNTYFYERLFRAFSKADINIVMISQASSEHSICFAIPPEAARVAKQLLDKEFENEIVMQQLDPVVLEEGLSVVAIVGSNMKNTPGVSAKLFSALADNDISVVAIAQGSSELNVSVVINAKDEAKALNAIHDMFFFKD